MCILISIKICFNKKYDKAKRSTMFIKNNFFKLIGCIFLFSGYFSSNIYCKNHEIDLTLSYKMVHFAHKNVKAIAINDSIPGPTLHFKEGDHVSIHVHNHLNENTSIHWHGLLLPWQMDGVEDVSQKPIPPKGVFHYQFTLKHSGTYWYHAHSSFQEQQGVYGAIIIDPIESPSYIYSKDHVVVLSDWSNTHPEQIWANLKKSGDYYAPKFPLQPSLFRFFRDYKNTDTKKRKKIISDYKMMQQMRMSIYDFSDVAYDAFLINGKNASDPWVQNVKVGDIVRLRFIGAGGSTIFHVKMPDTKMQMVHIQGNDVKPYWINDFTIAPGETYDVLVHIEKKTPYIIYAESADTLGAAYGVLVTDPNIKVDYRVEPFPTPEPVTMGHSMNHAGHKMGQDSKSISSKEEKMPEHNQHNTRSMSHNKKESLTKGTKYQDISASFKTNDPSKPFETINMALGGFMGRYMWFINGLPEHKADLIFFEPDKRYRLVFTNETMMHHPMHLHGHFFILRNGHGAYDPLLHTIDVAPGATAVADVDANASGQWFFHCHHLFHMISGMSRIFRYTSFPQDKATPESDHTNEHPLFSDHPVGHKQHLFFGKFLELSAHPFKNEQEASFKLKYGSDYNKIELYSEDAEIEKGKITTADLDCFYWRLISEFWAVKGGINYVYRPAKTPYVQPGIGIEGLMPYFIDTDIRAYVHKGSAKLDLQLSRDTQITNNFFIRNRIRSILATKTIAKDEIGCGLNQMQYVVRPFYRLSPAINIYAEYKHTDYIGNLKKIHRKIGESTKEDALNIGFSFMF